MTSEPKRKNLSGIAAKVAEEWRRAGKSLPVPLDLDTMTYEQETEFFDEVQRRFDAQTEEG